MKMQLKVNMSPGVLKFLFLAVFLFFSHSIKAEPIAGQTVILQILDKITAKVKSLEVDVNDKVIFESLNIEIYACHVNPPEETPEDFVLLKRIGKALKPKRFSAAEIMRFLKLKLN